MRRRSRHRRRAGKCNVTRDERGGARSSTGSPRIRPAGHGDRTLIIGDLNSYDKEDPIDVFTAAGYTDLLLAYQGEYAYSYVFDGQLGYLDHALAGPGLVADVTGASTGRSTPTRRRCSTTTSSSSRHPR